MDFICTNADFEKLTTTKAFIRKELTFDMSDFQEKIRKCEPTGSDKRLQRGLDKVFAAFKGNKNI